MSGREDEFHHAMFTHANDGVDHSGIDHSDYKQTDDFETPLHFDSTNNFQDNFGTSTYDAERHSQVKNPTSRLNPKPTNGSQQNNMINQAFQQAGCGANEFINALLNGDLPGFNPTEATVTLDALIDSGYCTDNFGSTVDDPSKGSKYKNFDDEDNQDIHGGDTSNACDDDNLGINSPGSSQASQNLYDKPCSSTASPAAPTPAHTMVVQPTSPPSAPMKDLQELEVYDPNTHSNDRGMPIEVINHEGYHGDQEYLEDQDYSNAQIIPRTTYASGLAVGPVQPQVILPSPIAAIPLPQTTTVADPMNASNHYSVDKTQLSEFLKANGRQVSGRKRKSKEEIERLVKRFCDPKELDYCTENDARDIIESDFEVKNVPLRNRSDKGKYLCKFCPITQNHARGFERKEDMKRHYHQHLNYVRFSCKHCEYKNARTDHMKNHMKKCHPEKDSMDYNRNS